MADEKRTFPEGEKILDALENIDGDLIEESTWEAYESRNGTDAGRKVIRFRGRKIAALAAAAVMVMAFGLVAFAAEVNSDFDAALLRTLGLSPEECTQLDDGTVQIDASSEAFGVSYVKDGAVLVEGREAAATMRVAQSIGDDRSAVIRISTDIEAPAEMVEGRDYLYFDNCVANLTDNGLFGSTPGSCGSVFETVVEDGKVGLIVTITDMEDLNTASVDISLSNLMMAHDLGEEDNPAEAQKIFEGSWNLKWTYNYSSRKRVVKVNEDVGTAGEPVTLKSVEISPMGIHVEAVGSRDGAAWQAAENPDTEAAGSVFELLSITGIRMSDGTVRNFDSSDVGGMTTDITGITFSNYVNTAAHGGGVLIPDQVTAVFINGREIPLG